MTTTSAGLGTQTYEQLAGALRGDLIGPADSRYDEARSVYNGMIDKRPAAIARCRDVADVVAASASPVSTASRSPPGAAAIRQGFAAGHRCAPSPAA